MSRPRVFQVPPGLRVRGMIPGATAPSMNNAPVRVRQHFGNFPGGMPNGDGSPGSPTWPYTENIQYGADGGLPSQQALTDPVPVGTPPPALSPDQLSMVSTPNGQSSRPWINPTTYATVPLTQTALNSLYPILQLNYKRNSLIIQNTSTATAPDTAPTLYVNFNTVPQVLGSLALPPGLGFYWGAADCPPRDAIYVVFGPFSNANLTTVISGCVVQGTYAPNG